MKLFIARFMALVALCLAMPAWAAPLASVSSPDKSLTVSFDIDHDGRVNYSVTRKGQPLITPSKMGFLLQDSFAMVRGFRFVSQDARSGEENWEQPWGEQRFIRNRYTQLRVHLTERNGLQRRLDVVFRIYDDGIGFRYEFPEQPGLTTVRIGDELTEFAVVEPGTAWWIPAFEWNRV